AIGPGSGPGKEDFGHHATGTPSPTGLDGIQGTMEDRTVLLNGTDLFRPKTVMGRAAHHHISLPIPSKNLEHISGKLVHLCLTDLNDLPTIAFDLSHHVPAFPFVVNAVQTNDHKVLCHGHHDIGMVYGKSVSLHGLVGREQHRGTVKILAELNEKVLIRPLGKGAIGLLVDSVHKDASGTLQ